MALLLLEPRPEQRPHPAHRPRRRARDPRGTGTPRPHGRRPQHQRHPQYAGVVDSAIEAAKAQGIAIDPQILQLIDANKGLLPH